MFFQNAFDTLNTTRVCGGNHFQNAIEISNIVFRDKSPNSVIIVNGERIQDAIVAAPMIHFPHNAPILYTYTDFIDLDTVKQIFKLNPKGDHGVQVYLVGGISEDVFGYLSSLGLSVKAITGENYFETAANVAAFQNYPENIMIVSDEYYWEGLSACAWAAHMGTPILLTTKDHLPEYTRDVIKKTQNANVFLFGSNDSISEVVEKEIHTLNVNFIGRISGMDPFDMAVNFAKYKSPVGDFGWGKTDRDGHAFTFSAIENMFNCVSGALFAHLGKHTPTLIIEKNKLPVVTRDYIESVKPITQGEPKPPFMHGFIIGCDNAISYDTQIDIERSLSIDEMHMNEMK